MTHASPSHSPPTSLSVEQHWQPPRLFLALSEGEGCGTASVKSAVVHSHVLGLHGHCPSLTDSPGRLPVLPAPLTVSALLRGTSVYLSLCAFVVLFLYLDGCRCASTIVSQLPTVLGVACCSGWRPGSKGHPVRPGVRGLCHLGLQGACDVGTATSRFPARFSERSPVVRWPVTVHKCFSSQCFFNVKSSSQNFLTQGSQGCSKPLQMR